MAVRGTDIKNLPIQNLPTIVGLETELAEYAKNLHISIDDNNNEIQKRLNSVGNVPLQFTDSDTTPSVLGANVFTTNTSGITITRFDDGVAGQEVTIISKGAIVYDTSPATRLIGSTVDITTANGDITIWVCETGGTTSSVWRLKGFVDISIDNSAGA